MTAAEALEFGIVDRIVERRVKDEESETTPESQDKEKKE
jgi:enoyl-CoA hydratase/carnithine racemase